MLDLLIITHTNPIEDARILKYYDTASKLRLRQKIIGVASGCKESKSTQIDVDNVSPFFRKLNNHKSREKRLLRYVYILFRMPLYFEVLAKLTLKIARNPSKIIHVNDQYALLPAVVISFFTRAKVIYDAHELESEANSISKEMKIFTILIEKISWHRIDCLIAVSPSVLSWYQEKYGKKDSVLVLNSPYVPIKVESSVHDARGYFVDKFRISENAVIYLYVGALEAGRGISLILSALNQTDSDSVVIFMGSGSLTNEIESNLDFGRRVFLHEPVHHSKVTSIALGADVGLCLIENTCLNDFFSLPNKFFEYIFAGVPVIASDFPEMSKLVTEYKLGKVIDPSIENLSAFFQGTWEIPERGDLPKIGALHECTWDYQEVKVKKLYEDLLY